MQKKKQNKTKPNKNKKEEKKGVIPTLTLFVFRVFFGQFLHKKIVFTTIFKTYSKFTLEKKGVIPASTLFVFSTVFDVFTRFFGPSSHFEFIVPVSKFTLLFPLGYGVK